MKILLVVHRYPPYSLGGTEVYTRNLAQELVRRGHEPILYFRADSDAASFSAWDENLEGIRGRRVSAPLQGWRSSPLVEFYRTFRNADIEQDFKSFLQQERPDVVHFQHVMALSADLLPIARDLGYPSVLTLHDYWFICANAQLIWPDARVCQGKAWGLNCARCALARLGGGERSWPLRPALAPLFRWRDGVVRRAAMAVERFIAPSRFLIERYVEYGFPSARFTYLENGLDVDRLRGYVRHPTLDDRMRFTFIGSLAWQKGVHVMVDAFRTVPLKKTRLRIYGSLQTFPQYSADLRQRHNPETTEFMGAIPNTQVGAVLADTDVLIVPSLWYENSPVVIQEAYALGVPVIASRIGALQEKVCEGETGWFFSPGNSQALRKIVQQLIENRQVLDQMLSHSFPVLSVKEHTGRLMVLYNC